MSRVLVTGANGHVGCNTVRALLDEGHQVVAFTRPNADRQGLAGLDVVSAHGDVRDAKAVETASEGCDVIINHAAVYDMQSTDVEAIVQPAVQGIENVLRAANSHGIKRVIHTSSTVAVGFGRDPSKVMDERDWNDDPILPYTRAKTESERRARQMAEELSVPMVTINPSMILGQHDYRPTPSTGLIRAMVEGEMPTGKGGVGMVDVRDVALAHVRALDKGEPGERYIVSGEHLLMRELGAIIQDLTGFKVAYMPAPRFLLPLIVPLVAMQARRAGREPPINMPMAKEVVGRFGNYNSAKAQKAFGLTLRGARECVESTIRWLLFRGQLSDGRASNLGDKFAPDPAWSS